MRHLGWLHATPEGSKKSRLSAFKEIDEDHSSLVLPDINSDIAAGYIVGLLHEAGLMSSNGMGPVPLSWGDINDWLKCTELCVPLWEKMVIKTLSEEYVSELILSKDKSRPPPYTQSKIDLDRKVVADKIFSILSKRMRKQETSTE